MLELTDLFVDRGATPVIHGVSMAVKRSECVCLLGRNGMGKTTVLRAIIGLTTARSGHVKLDDVEITRRPPHVIARMGVGYVPQERGVFAGHSVEENLFIGLRRVAGARDTVDAVYTLFPRLLERRRQRAGTLSGGEQQMLAVARCLMLRPKILLLDEPTEGLQPSIVQQLEEALRSIQHEFGLAMLLVEQNLDFAFSASERGYVLEKGEIVAEGSVESLRDAAVIKEYLAV